MSTIDTIGFSPAQARPASVFGGSLTLVIRAAYGWINRAIDRRRSRLALLELTDEQLKDIGLSRADAYCEGIKPMWTSNRS